MGTLDELRKHLGEDLGKSTATVVGRHNWTELCVCGHIAKYHPAADGGLWEPPASTTKTVAGREMTSIFTSEGCTGAMPPRNWEATSTAVDRETGVSTITWRATCPCRKMRPVVAVDRPNRFFNQRVNRGRPHPFDTGVRAFVTHLSRRKGALDDPAWATAEFDRRFAWIPENRTCSISGCKKQGDGVFPAFVNGDLHSELRCELHRD